MDETERCHYPAAPQKVLSNRFTAPVASCVEGSKMPLEDINRRSTRGNESLSQYQCIMYDVSCASTYNVLRIVYFVRCSGREGMRVEWRAIHNAAQSIILLYYNPTIIIAIINRVYSY